MECGIGEISTNRRSCHWKSGNVLDQIAAQKIGYQPTLQVLQGLTAYFDPEYLKMAAIPKVVPAGMLEWFESPEGKWFKKEIAGDNTPDAVMREAFDHGPIRRGQQVVAYLAKMPIFFWARILLRRLPTGICRA